MFYVRSQGNQIAYILLNGRVKYFELENDKIRYISDICSYPPLSFYFGSAVEYTNKEFIEKFIDKPLLLLDILKHCCLIKKHHTAMTRLYVSRKTNGYISAYNKRFGNGLVYDRPNWNSTSYSFRDYYIFTTDYYTDNKEYTSLCYPDGIEE